MTQAYPYDPSLQEHWLHQEAQTKTQKLSGIIPIKLLRMREAILSSKIEGYHCTIQEIGRYLLRRDSQPSTPDTRITASCYYALAKVEELYVQEQEKLSHLLIWALHRELFQHDDYMTKGKYRDINVRIGGYTPPHPVKVPEYMDELLEYIHTTDDPPLIRAGIAHAQYENVHPFPDGNGRTGRMLLSLLVGEGESHLYPYIWDSGVFWYRRRGYYRTLNMTNRDPNQPDFTEFLKLYLTGLGLSLDEKRHLVRQIQRLPKVPEQILQNPIDLRENLIHAHGIQEVEKLVREKILVPDSQDPEILVYLPLLHLFQKTNPA